MWADPELERRNVALRMVCYLPEVDFKAAEARVQDCALDQVSGKQTRKGRETPSCVRCAVDQTSPSGLSISWEVSSHS